MTGPEGNLLFPDKAHGELDVSDGVSFIAWARVWAEFGVRCASRETHEEFLRCYCEPQRTYNNRQHLEECLQVLKFVNAACQASAEVELSGYMARSTSPIRCDN